MIPIAITTVQIDSQSEPEPGEGITLATRATGVRAVISTPTGSEIPGPGGGAERIDAVLICDPVTSMTHTDKVYAPTGEEYEVAWVTQRQGLGLDHTAAGLVIKTGRTPGG
jgi:hypothetical protein